MSRSNDLKALIRAGRRLANVAYRVHDVGRPDSKLLASVKVAQEEWDTVLRGFLDNVASQKRSRDE